MDAKDVRPGRGTRTRGTSATTSHQEHVTNSALVPPRPGRQLVDEYFIENRTRLLDIAAFLDRLDPAHVIANRAAEAMGTELTPRQPHPAGIGVHYGLSLLLMQDEGLNPILGTSGRPADYPMEAYFRGLIGHLVLGATTHATPKLLDQVM